MSVMEKYDASQAVEGGRPDGGMGDYIDSLRDDCGLIIGAILWAVKKFAHRDLLAELLEPIAGDFNAISSMQKGWLQVASASGAVGDNYASLRSQVAPVLDGQAAASIDAILDRIAEAHQGQEDAAELIAEQMGNMLEVAQATAECVCAALEFIDSCIQEILADAAVPFAGWVKAGVSAPGKVRRVIQLISQGKDAIENLLRFAKVAITAMKYLNALFDTANLVLNAIELGGDTDNSTDVDDTADAGF